MNGPSADSLKQWQNQEEIPNARTESVTKLSSTLTMRKSKSWDGWYYYREGKLRFPFRAKCVTSKVVSPLRKGEVGEVSRMARENACSADMLAIIAFEAGSALSTRLPERARIMWRIELASARKSLLSISTRPGRLYTIAQIASILHSSRTVGAERLRLERDEFGKYFAVKK